MKIILPIAGKGSRFNHHGINTPKPLIEALNKPMIWWALQSVKDIVYSEMIVIALTEHEVDYGISQIFNEMGYSNVKFIFLDKITDGQLCTVLTAREHIDTEEDILIANTDTYVQSNIFIDIENKPNGCSGIISVAEILGNQWSFARTNDEGRVVQVAEKKRISDNASTGLYYFNNGSEFLESADELIRKGQKTKGEYYVIPVYQHYIDEGKLVCISKSKQMWDLGTPESLKHFVDNFLANGGSI